MPRSRRRRELAADDDAGSARDATVAADAQRSRGIEAVVVSCARLRRGASSGTAATDPTNRFTIPYEEPADRELVAVRLLLPFRCSPIFLTRYAA